MNLSTDADIEFTFVKMPKGLSSDGEDQGVDIHKYLEFYCQPSALKITANQQAFLNVLIKVNTAKLSSEVSDQELLRRPVNKLLIARLKDTSVLFSYFISISMINQ
jgi:hypothetical protein